MNDKKLLLNNEKRERLKKSRTYLGISQEAMGEKLSITGADIKNRENGVVEIKQIFADALEKNLKISSVWIMTGQGAMTTGHGTGTYVGETDPSYTAASETIPIRISDPLIQKTAAILESHTPYSNALKSNIEAFHHAMSCEEQLGAANKRIDTLEEHVKAIESRLPKANES